jgi:sugar (pentulose or hexulose) kinase
MSDAILCVDIGTTSLKAALITPPDGEVVSFCSVPIEESQNTASLWYGAFFQAVCDLKGQCALTGKSVGAIDKIVISGNGPTVVSDDGYTVFWNEDLADVKIPDDAEVRKSLFVPKILALKKRNKKSYKNTRWIFSGPEYLIYVLTGQAVTILPEERFKPAYWNEQVCKTCGIDFEKLPPFVGIGEVCGIVQKSISNDLSVSGFRFAQNCRVIAGGPDFIVALIGTGTLRAGRLCDRCGSSEGLNFCTDRPITGEGLRTLPSVIPGLWNVSYLIPNSGELSDDERLAAVEKGVNTLKAAAEAAGIPFPSEMAVTGGQTNDELLLKEKAQRLNMKILRPKNNFAHCELLGDLCAGVLELDFFKSLQEAADFIVKMEPYENL